MQAVIEVDPLPPAPRWQADGVRAWTLGLGRARLKPGSYLARDPDDDVDEQPRQPQKPEGADGGRVARSPIRKIRSSINPAQTFLYLLSNRVGSPIRYGSRVSRRSREMVVARLL